MAVMSRGKQSLNQMWALKNKKRENKALSAQEEKPVSEEEKKRRLEMLKQMGLIK